MQANLLAPHGLNPYRLGYHLLMEVEERWDKGRFGPEYEALPLGERLRYERPTGEGRKKLFQVRTVYTDLNFLEEFLTPEFALRRGLLPSRTCPASRRPKRPSSSASPTWATPSWSSWTPTTKTAGSFSSPTLMRGWSWT